MRRRTIDDLLAAARAGLERVTAEQAAAAMQNGGVLVDVRSADERARQGVVIPEALLLPLSVVLWRLDPAEPAGGAPVPLDARVMLICRQGYSSSLAAALPVEPAHQTPSHDSGIIPFGAAARSAASSRASPRMKPGPARTLVRAAR